MAFKSRKRKYNSKKHKYKYRRKTIKRRTRKIKTQKGGLKNIAEKRNKLAITLRAIGRVFRNKYL